MILVLVIRKKEIARKTTKALRQIASESEITEKDRVQKNFKEKIMCCVDDKSSIDNFDWSGVKAILEGIFILFHEDDGLQIISWAEE